MSKFTAQTARFCDLAKRGALPGASSGERAAHKLAASLNKISDDIMVLDEDTIEGYCHLVRLAAGPFFTEDGKSVVYDTIRQASGN